jgi:oligopeptide transport system substrate-binding protein
MRMKNCYRLLLSGFLVVFLLVTSLLPGCSKPPLAEFKANVAIGQAPLLVEFTNISKNADNFHWDFGDGASIDVVDTSVVTHQYTKAGTFTIVLTASQGKGDKSLVNSATTAVEVNHGSLSQVIILPNQSEIECTKTQSFVAEARDAYDNPIPEVQLFWSMSESAGKIDNIGTATAGGKVGTYPNSIKVIAKFGNISVEETASIVIRHGPLYQVIVTPQGLSVKSGESKQFTAIAVDKYGNQISNSQFTWEAQQNAGQISQNGLFVAGDLEGSFNNGVAVTANSGTFSVSAGVLIIISNLSPVGPQILSVNLAGEPQTIDPNRASWAGERSVIMQCFDGLLAFNPDLSLKSMVAREIPAIVNGGISTDGKTYTFKLRSDVTWSDGKKVTARDFEYSLKRVLSPDLAADYASFYFVIAGAEQYYSAREKTPTEKAALRDAVGIKAVDDYTLEIKLVEIHPAFLQLMALWPAYPVREDIITQFGDKWTEPPSYIGNGPFVLKEWIHQDRMTFIRNENYWGKKPYLTEITFRMITDSNVVLALYKQNELDQSGVPGGTEKAIMSDPSLNTQIVRYPQLVTYSFQFNVTKAPFNNKLLRQALATAIDRAAFIDQVRGGVGTQAYSWIPPGMPGYNPELGKQYGFNAAKARKLLVEAGYPDPLTLKLKFQYSNSGTHVAIAAFLQSQMKNNLGIDLILEPMDAKAFSALVNSKQFDWSYTGWGGDYPDPDNWLPQLFGTNAGNNKTGYSNPQFDTLSTQALKELDETKRLQLWMDAHAVVIEDSPMIFLFNRETFVLKKSWVNGLITTGMDAQIAGDMYLREVYIQR